MVIRPLEKSRFIQQIAGKKNANITYLTGPVAQLKTLVKVYAVNI
jgi:hypothetical protein